jgi:kumamolisin
MKRSNCRRSFWAAAVVAVLVFARITSEADSQDVHDRARITRHTLPALQRARFAGEASRRQELNLAVALKVSDRAALNQRIEQLYDPASPLYHQFLTPAQFADEFGPSQGDYDTVVSFLRDSGLQVTATYPNRLLIDVQGSVAQVEEIFGVKINNYTQNNQSFFANDRDPALPLSIASVVGSVRGMENYLELRRHTRLRSSARNFSHTPPGYSPQQIAIAYNFNSAYSNGITGRGQTVAIATAYGFSATDVAKFWKYYGIRAPKYSTVAVGGKTRYIDFETTLDLEWAGAMANGASFIVYQAATPLLSTFASVYNKIVSDNKAAVVSTSWGLCEQEMPDAFLVANSNIFAEAAVQGQTWFAASGDNGSNDCGTLTLAADYPSSDPNVVAVGGTTLRLTNSGSVLSETAWTDGGGGLSVVFNQPLYQTGLGVLNAYSNGMRQTADVAFNADPNTGYSVYFNRSWWQLGGTSFGAPQWAGIFALVNQAHGSRLGAGGPSLYGLANNNPAQIYPAFHDTSDGNNGYYPSVSFWDYPTGWGSPDVWNLVRDLQ